MKRLAKLLHAVSPNCQEAIRLQSESLDRRLSIWQRAGLSIHLALCTWCRRYGRQIAFLRTAAKANAGTGQPEQTLSPDAHQRIKKALKATEN